jgi:hypothetical protein
LTFVHVCGIIKVSDKNSLEKEQIMGRGQGGAGRTRRGGGTPFGDALSSVPGVTDTGDTYKGERIYEYRGMEIGVSEDQDAWSIYDPETGADVDGSLSDIIAPSSIPNAGAISASNLIDIADSLR